MHSTGQFPNETYINGLRDNPDSTLDVVYDEFRPAILQAVTALGGSAADGAVFFQAAVNDAARLVRTRQAPAEVPLPDLLEIFARAHYRDWLAEHEQPVPETGAAEAAEIAPLAHLLSPETLRSTRRNIFAWKQLQRLDVECRHSLQQPPEAAAPETAEQEPPTETWNDCADQYRKLIDVTETTLPAWALTAARDTDGFSVWQRTHALEHRWAEGLPAAPESNRAWPWAIAALFIVAIGYGAYQFFFRPKTAAEVFADNFAPPASLMEDLDVRYGAEMGNDSVSARPNRCVMFMREADAYYRAKEYEAALDPLLLIVLDSTSICQSDAWFFLGIIQLHLEDPATAIQCFAKIEDLGRYGEDLYWYQALAFVQLAKENPLMRDKARRAVERALGNTREPNRRAQAEKMLQNLSQ